MEEPGVKNLVVSFNSELDEPITVIGAHWDVFNNSQGMNDNGVAVVALIRIACILKRINVKKRVDLVFFDREETGMLGSDTYIRNVGPENIEHAIILDIIAYGDTIMGSFYKYYISHNFGPELYRLSYALPSDNVIFNRYNVKNVLFTVGHNYDLTLTKDRKGSQLVYFPSATAEFYSSFHNRVNDNKIEILDFNIARRVYKMALSGALSE